MVLIWYLQILRQTLDELGQLDNTVIIIAGDHGYFYGEHGLNEERRLAYEESIRIPLIVWYPSLIHGGRTPIPFALNLDVAPTILDLAGLPPEAGMQGVSLRPLFNSTPNSWRTSFLVEYYSDIVFPRIRNMGYQAIRTERYTFIDYLELPGMEELYDLLNDPFQMENIINTPAGQSLLPGIRDEIAKLQTTSGVVRK
jgi:N-acetylglucosamine-6-sulfatase